MLLWIEEICSLIKISFICLLKFSGNCLESFLRDITTIELLALSGNIWMHLSVISLNSGMNFCTSYFSRIYLPHFRKNWRNIYSKPKWHAERIIRRRHLLSLLSSDSIKSHMTRDPLNISLFAESGISHPVSPAITAGHSLLSASQSNLSSACLAVGLPTKGDGSEFHVSHSWSYRWLRCALYTGGSTVPCRQLWNLQPDHTLLTRGTAFDLLVLSRSVLINDACRHSDVFTISHVPSP